jgi:predicted 2-oxoglutarate/Fe(II)-dependent dioxygenase YbiX
MEYTKLGIGVYQYDLPETLAKNIVEMCRQSANLPWKKSGVGHDDNPDQTIRTSRGLPFGETLPFWDEEVRKYTTPAVNHYSAEYGTSITQDETFNLLNYGITQKYDFHVDTNWDIYRTVSILVYLNPTEYEGGGTHFKHFDLIVKPEKPCIVIFPSNYIYLHAAMPVTEGEKYVLVSWMNDLPRGIHPAILGTIVNAVGRA